MSDNGKRYYWIKLKTDFFSKDEIDFLMSQKNGSDYIVLYQMLCLMTANNNGKLSTNIGEMIIPYDVNKIARETKYFNSDTVVVALELFKRLGLIYQQEDTVLVIDRFDELVGSETSAAKRMREHRLRESLQPNETKRLKTAEKGVTSLHQSYTDVTQENRDKILEIRDIDIKDIETEIEDTPDFDSRGSSTPIPYQQIKSLYNEICVSYPHCKAMSEARKKAIRARVNSGYTLEDFKTLFEKAEASTFLKGGNNRNWTASFDWLLTDSNMAKVLDGNYDNRNDKVTYARPQENTSNQFLQLLQEGAFDDE